MAYKIFVTGQIFNKFIKVANLAIFINMSIVYSVNQNEKDEKI